MTGLQIPYDVFDSELGVPCTPREFADGEWRCLPSARWRVGYADEGCEEPIVLSLLDGQSPTPGMIAVTRDVDCSIPEDEPLYLIGDELPRPSTTYSLDVGGVCTGNATAEYQRAFAVTPLAVADLVSLTRGETEIGSRLSAPIGGGDDGSRIYVERGGRGLRDVERDTTVDLDLAESRDAEASWRLLPEVRVDAPACTMQPCDGSGVGGSPPSAPFFAAPSGLGACDAPRDVNHVSWWRGQSVETYRVEETEATIYVAAGGSSPGGPQQMHGYQALERVPLEAWQEAASFSTGKRVAVQGRQVDGVAIYSSPFLVDGELDGQPCTIGEAEDGALRCLPTGGQIVFADDSCSEPIAYNLESGGTGGTSAGGTSAGPAPSATFAISRPEGWEGPQMVFRVGEPTTKSQYFWPTVVGCVPVSIEGASTFSATAVDPEMFAPFSVEER